jgi:uncharacterized membrane protein YidH (DUF202 family)
MDPRIPGVSENAFQSPSRTRLWALRAAALCLPLALIPRLAWSVAHAGMSQLVMICLASFVIGVAALIACYAEATYRREDHADADDRLIERFSRSGLRQVAMIIVATPVFALGYTLSGEHLHTSAMVSGLCGMIPMFLLLRIGSWIWPVSAGTTEETVRARLLMLDKQRRQWAINYVLFTIMWLIITAYWVAQIVHATCGGLASYMEFHTFGYIGITSLLMLLAPTGLFDNAAARVASSDEAMIRFRQMAYKNAFLVAGFGMIILCDLVIGYRSVALLGLPALFGASLATAFATLAFLEYRAGSFTSDGDEQPTTRGDA